MTPSRLKVLLKTGIFRSLFYKPADIQLVVGRVWVDRRGENTYIVIKDNGKPFDITKYLSEMMKNGGIQKGNKK
ncbi:MAG: hypothetical protein CMO34_07935 [Verrucomicrobia bacterium]|nr:hypothetical protein [Verrucomicrobiota bacterium]